MAANDDHDIPLNEPGFSLEPEDDLNEDDISGESEDSGADALECDMVYVLSAKYALLDSLSTCPVVDVKGMMIRSLFLNRRMKLLPWKLILL